MVDELQKPAVTRSRKLGDPRTRSGSGDVGAVLMVLYFILLAVISAASAQEPSPARRLPRLAVVPARRWGVRGESERGNQGRQQEEGIIRSPAERGWRSFRNSAERFQEILEDCQKENEEAEGEW